jgi:hypothetical protein
MHPVGDNLKVKIDASDEYGFGASAAGVETGVVVEVPKEIHFFGFHSFAFERSFMAKEQLEELRKFYDSLVGKRIWWEAYQDRGRRIKEGDKEYVYLKMSDVLIYSDDPNQTANLVEDTRSGSFKI